MKNAHMLMSDRKVVSRFPGNFSPAEVRPNLYGVD
jgi:hypothetical protein